MNNFLKQSIPHTIAIIGFFLITLVYFYPNFQGKVLNAHDNLTSAGNSKEIKDHLKIYDEQTFWTNNLFSGMPSYLISTVSYANLISYIHKSTKLGMPPVHNFFLYMVGFYILLLVLGLNHWQSAIGAISFGLSTYFIIIIGAGHNTKAAAIAYMAPIVAGVILTFRKKYLLGCAITAFFLALEITANHLQITYYLLMILIVYGVFKFYEGFKEKEFKHLGISSAFLLIALLLALGTNYTQMALSLEYTKESSRGKSELTDISGNKTSGLDKDYVTGWSYGIAESWTLLIPDFMGGKSYGPLDTDSETYKELKSRNIPNARSIIKQVPLYWGQQPGQSGPVYIGAIICFLFVLGLFVVKGPMKWWLLIVTILSIVLAWGKHFMPLTDFFLDYVPLYNKFRSVTMILVMAEWAMPLLGFLALKEVLSKNLTEKTTINSIKYSVLITAGLCFVFMLIPGAFFDFSSSSDEQLLNSGWPQFLLDALIEDRESILRSDAFRSLAFILLAAGLLVFHIKGKVKENVFYALLLILTIADLYPVNRRYVNYDNFVKKKVKTIAINPTQADISILQREYSNNDGAKELYQTLLLDAKEAKKTSSKPGKRNLSQEEMIDIQFTALKFNSNYRVMNMSISTFNDASTGYFHKSIGGYHGAKMKRYQELISHHIGKRNQKVINMLNAKYFIFPGEDKRPLAQENPGALGNAWFVEDVEIVQDANAEISALETFNPAKTAIIDKRFENLLSGFVSDSSANNGFITQLDYKPNKLIYDYEIEKSRLVVFSEIYYQPGWNAYIDGQLTDHFRVNYVLRGMVVPAGKHKIEFVFEPKSFDNGEKIAFASSLLLLLIFIGSMFKEIKGNIVKPELTN